MPIQIPTVQELRDILQAVTVAVLKLDVGYKFTGAFGEAKAAGYRPGTVQYNVFVSMYLSNIENVAIYTDDAGRITKIMVKQ